MKKLARFYSIPFFFFFFFGQDCRGKVQCLSIRKVKSGHPFEMHLLGWGCGNIGPVGVGSAGEFPRVVGSPWPAQGEAVSRGCVGGQCRPVLCSETPRHSLFQVTRQPSVAVANCLDTKVNAVPGGGQRWFAETQRTSQLRKGCCSSHLETLVGVRQWKTLKPKMAV